MKKTLGIMAAVLVAGFAAAEITYPVNVGATRWAVMDSNTGQVIARNKAWPVASGGPINGLASNIVYLLHVSETAPAYDARIFSLNSIEVADPEANTLTKTYQAVPRPKEEVKVAAENREMEELQKHNVDLAREVLQTRLMLTALITYSIDNQALPPKVRTFAESYRNKGVKLWKNRDRVKELLDAIENDQQFDLDEGWEAPEAEEETP